MPPSRRQDTPQERIERLSEEALRVARSAKRQRRSLSGVNHYANKLAELRADAASAFRDLQSTSVGDASALAELIEACFAPGTDSRIRAEAARELRVQLRGIRPITEATRSEGEEDAIFPLSLLAQTRRGYLVHVCRQMNGCFAKGWWDACAVMMRRLVETAIIEAFEGRGLEQKAKGTDGEFLQLSALVNAALAETSWNLSRNTKIALPMLREVGHLSAHGRRFTAQRSDVERVRQGCRVSIEELLRIAGLL